MIHAYLFVTHNYFDRDDHGEQFQKHMNRINKAAKSHITVYHTFHDEVDYCRKWWWRCDGRCRSKPPYYGYVKRAVNRPPQAADWWFAKHQEECGGKFHLVKSPEKRIDTLFSKQCFVLLNTHLSTVGIIIVIFIFIIIIITCISVKDFGKNRKSSKKCSNWGSNPRPSRY